MKTLNIAGRKEELEVLKNVLESPVPELVALYGRRRVGKTFLVRAFFKDDISFEFSGTINTISSQQLYNFAQTLTTLKGKKQGIPDNWQEAFAMLTKHIESIRHQKKKVIFFDELPWLDTMHSGFLQAFDYFWNSWCTKRNDIIVVICSSAASWMIKKIINNKGGLHNRLTRRIRLLPFTLSETQEFFKLKKIKLDPYQVTQLYMAMGGVPHYLNEVQAGKSAMQNIDAICFSEKGLLNNEFENLYAALYTNAQVHIKIIRALALKRTGLLRNEIAKTARLKSGGYLTGVLKELIESGFIAAYVPLDKKTKETVYRLMDEYSLFFIKFIEQAKALRAGTWATLSKSQSYITWSGYAFENLCLKHVGCIKRSLGISAIYTEESAWYNREEKAQIDLVIKRADNCINLCEIKYTTTLFEITAKYSKELQQKSMAYKSVIKSRNTIFTTLITPFGLKQNQHKLDYVDSEVTLEDFFQ